ncbi:MAG TPA: L,D-transpeptidase family protein [bacterium]
MRRQLVVAVGIAVAIMVGIGGIILGAQHGVFGARDRQLLNTAARAVEQQRPEDARAALEELIEVFPDSPLADDALLRLGELHAAQHAYVESSAMYTMLLERFPASALASQAQERLGHINVAILFSPTVTQADAVYEVLPGDTLVEIAEAHRTTVDLIKQANGITGDLIRPKQRLKIPQGEFEIVVDKSQKELLLKKDGRFLKTYPIATGRDDSTPEGAFKIVNRIPNPVWYKQGAIVPPDSEENILGTRWLGFDKAGYGIHGTVDAAPIKEQATAGCVRMRNDDVEELFAIVPVGTDVTIIN